MQKYLVSYKGRAIGVGDNVSEALEQALSVITKK